MVPTARPRVLFVTYEASRTGSPLLLLRFLRWLVATQAVDPEVVCWRGGPLAGAFAGLAPTRVLAPASGRSLAETVAVGAGEVGLGALGRLVDRGRIAVGLRGRRRPDVIHLNGVPAFTALPHLGSDGVPVLGHVHELEFALRRSLAPEEAHLLGAADRYVAVSHAVADNLAARHGIAPERVAVHHGFVDEAPAPDAVATDRAVAAVRAELGLPPGVPVVVMVGDLTWRKGADLFVALAAALAERDPSAHLVWVGGAPGRGAWDETAFDVAACDVGDRVHLVGERDDVAPFLAVADVLALTSREDPFPLVAVEAAQAGVPVVAFDQGGVPELLTVPGEPAAGVLVPPLDVAAMADAVGELLGALALRAALGDAGSKRVAAHHTTAVAAPALLAELEALW